MPNSDQFASLLRTLLKIVGTILTTHGLITSGVWEPIAGAVIALAPIGWDMLTHAQKATIAKIAAIADDPNSPIQGIITTATAEGQRLANAVPSSAVVAAGTSAAAELAKP